MNTMVVGVQDVENGRAKGSLDIPVLKGEFCAQDSQQNVLQLLVDLKNHHHRRNFSHQERFGKPDPWSEAMLADLDAALEDTRQFIKISQERNIPFTVESSIKVRLSTPVE